MAESCAANVIIFDMDSTLIQIECIDEIASLTGAGEKVAAITERAMQGELDFEQSLRARVACLRGVNIRSFERLFNPIPFTPGAQQLLAELKQRGWKTALVSGGFSWFAERVANQLGMDAFSANHLQHHEGTLTGELEGQVIDAQVKAEKVHQFKRQWAGASGTTVAVGDGANDQLMLQTADIGVAFCAKPVLRSFADICIDQCDLSLLLPQLQQRGLISGYPLT